MTLLGSRGSWLRVLRVSSPYLAMLITAYGLSSTYFMLMHSWILFPYNDVNHLLITLYYKKYIHVQKLQQNYGSSIFLRNLMLLICNF
jgi:hypothetical protein